MNVIHPTDQHPSCQPEALTQFHATRHCILLRFALTQIHTHALSTTDSKLFSASRTSQHSLLSMSVCVDVIASVIISFFLLIVRASLVPSSSLPRPWGQFDRLSLNDIVQITSPKMMGHRKSMNSSLPTREEHLPDVQEEGDVTPT